MEAGVEEISVFREMLESFFTSILIAQVMRMTQNEIQSAESQLARSDCNDKMDAESVRERRDNEPTGQRTEDNF